MQQTNAVQGRKMKVTYMAGEKVKEGMSAIYGEAAASFFANQRKWSRAKKKQTLTEAKTTRRLGQA
jgi:hypothetical protein